jgi:rRNA-processing protein EBP2
MAKKKKGNSSKVASSGKKTRKQDTPKSPPSGTKHDKVSSILEAVEAMSSSDEEPIDQANKTSNVKADALRKLIKEGSFNTLLEKDFKDEDDDSIEEVILGDDDDDDDIEDDGQSENVFEGDSKGAKVADADEGKTNQQMDDENEEGSKGNDLNHSEEEEDDDENSTDQGVFDTNSKALLAKTAQLQAEKKKFPWVERFDVVPPGSLPFGTIDEGTGKKIDVHDDLAREVAFYDFALEAVRLARAECKKAGVPFTRPDDFFAEMVKSDGRYSLVIGMMSLSIFGIALPVLLSTI